MRKSLREAWILNVCGAIPLEDRKNALRLPTKGELWIVTESYDIMDRLTHRTEPHGSVRAMLYEYRDELVMRDTLVYGYEWWQRVLPQWIPIRGMEDDRWRYYQLCFHLYSENIVGHVSEALRE